MEGRLESVDQFLNLKLSGMRLLEEARYPHLLSVKNCFIRGSVIRYVQVPEDAVDKDLLQDAARREYLHSIGGINPTRHKEQQ